MGLGDFIKNIFGKKSCALCGAECGITKRSKIKNDEYICSDCADKCSRYIRFKRFSLDEIKEHIEYMKRQERLYNEVFSQTGIKYNCPNTLTNEGIRFCDDLGMFAITYKNNFGRGKMHELFRYDQVAAVREYLTEVKPQESGKKPEFKSCGIRIKLVDGTMDRSEMHRGLKVHPYITDEIDVCFSEKDRNLFGAAKDAKRHFDYIFGIKDNEKGLFDFGLSKKEERDLKGAVSMAGIFAEAAKAAVKGESISPEREAELLEKGKAVDDAFTGGLAEYTRRADEAESKIS